MEDVMADEPGKLQQRLEVLAHDFGVRVFGVADLEAAAREAPDLFARIGAPYLRAIVMGIPLNSAALEGLKDAPTPIYFHAYRQLNYRLDVAAFNVAQALVEQGNRALAIAASQIIERDPPRGHISHRHLGTAAGIGWMGRSGLLVTPAFGARVRLVTVLTDALLNRGAVMPFSCGECVACIRACPARAIAKSPEDFRLAACCAKLTEFTRIPYIGQHICGVCVKACAPENPGRALDAGGNPVEVSAGG